MLLPVHRHRRSDSIPGAANLRHNNTRTAIEFLQQVREHFPFCHPEDPDGQRFDPSASRSRGIFRTWVSPTSTFHLRVPKPTARSSGVIRQIPRSLVGENASRIERIWFERSNDGKRSTTRIAPISRGMAKLPLSEFANPLSHPRFCCESCNYCNGLSVLAAAAPWLY